MASGTEHPPIITLLTDFGLEDVYVGVMKGVILGLNPTARLVDLSHAVPPQDVLSGAFLLQSAWRYFPPGTIHLAVVDPGVGSNRRALAASAGGHYWVGPDNGLFSLIFSNHPPAVMVSLENAAYFLPQISDTFHGRDIFAPVAAHMSLGITLASLGPALRDPVGLEVPLPEFGAGEARGHVIWRDHFGNLITNVPMDRLRSWLAGRPGCIWLESHRIPHLTETYSAVPPGALLALGGSHGYLEIACREGSATQVLGAKVGARVRVEI